MGIRELFAEEVEELADPDPHGGAGYDDDPVDGLQGHDAEELAPYADDQDLAEEYGEGDQHESAASFEMECGAACLEGAGDNFHISHPLFKLAVCQKGEFRSGDDVALAVCRVIP